MLQCGVLKNFELISRRFRFSVNAFFASKKEKPFTFVIVNRSSAKQWPNASLGPIDSVNPKCPLPGMVGMVPLKSVERNKSSPFVQATLTLPPLKEENYSSVLIETYNATELNNTQNTLIPAKSDQLECTIHTCPTLIKQDLMSLFPSRQFDSNPLTAIVLNHRTERGFNQQWDESAAIERESLSESFINSAIDICSSLKELGYWADFINPYTGTPYLGAHGETRLTETDDRMIHFGFELDDVLCCKVLRHPKWKHNIFAGLIFTDAPKDHPDFFGIEKDQTERENTRPEGLLTSHHDDNYIDDQFFNNIDNPANFPSSESTSEAIAKNLCADEDLEEIDSQYFGHSKAQESSSGSNACSTDLVVEPGDHIDQLYFGRASSHSTTQESATINDVCSNDSMLKKHDQVDQFFFGNASSTVEREKTRSAQSSSRKPRPSVNGESIVRVGDVLRDVRKKTKLNVYTGQVLDLPDSSNRSTSIDDRLDSQGYRVPDGDTIKFHLLSENEAANALLSSIQLVQDDLIILNKPYGISSHAGSGHKHSIVSLLPRLEHHIRYKTQRKSDCPSEFFITHRLDRECTGLMLIARNRDASLSLQEAFAKRWIRKRYLCVVVGIPREMQGTIELPLAEKKFNEIYKMCVVPFKRSPALHTSDSPFLESGARISSDNPTVSSHLPSTHYELLSRKNDASLLLCSALTGLKHQIRVHLSMGLRTPILGDHKYSHATYLAPQRLPHRILRSLDIRQSKVRYLPLHLHAVELEVNKSCSSKHSALEFLQSHSTKLRASPPAFFLDNLKRIGLTLPIYLLRSFRP